mgnify:CR=1 FL=1
MIIYNHDFYIAAKKLQWNSLQNGPPNIAGPVITTLFLGFQHVTSAAFLRSLFCINCSSVLPWTEYNLFGMVVAVFTYANIWTFLYLKAKFCRSLNWTS